MQHRDRSRGVYKRRPGASNPMVVGFEDSGVYSYTPVDGNYSLECFSIGFNITEFYWIDLDDATAKCALVCAPQAIRWVGLRRDMRCVCTIGLTNSSFQELLDCCTTSEFKFWQLEVPISESFRASVMCYSIENRADVVQWARALSHTCERESDYLIKTKTMVCIETDENAKISKKSGIKLACKYRSWQWCYIDLSVNCRGGFFDKVLIGNK